MLLLTYYKYVVQVLLHNNNFSMLKLTPSFFLSFSRQTRFHGAEQPDADAIDQPGPVGAFTHSELGRNRK